MDIVYIYPSYCTEHRHDSSPFLDLVLLVPMLFEFELVCLSVPELANFGIG